MDSYLERRYNLEDVIRPNTRLRACARDIIIGKVKSTDLMTDRPLITIVLLERGTELHEVLILQSLATRGLDKKSCPHRSDIELIASITET